jgi:hypothetical protein
MQDVGPVVEDAPEAVTAEVAYDTAPLGLGVGLDGMPDVPGGVPRLDRRLISPTAYMRLVSPYQPSTISVTSMLRTSPSRNGLALGIP